MALEKDLDKGYLNCSERVNNILNRRFNTGTKLIGDHTLECPMEKRKVLFRYKCLKLIPASEGDERAVYLKLFNGWRIVARRCPYATQYLINKRKTRLKGVVCGYSCED